MEDMIFQIICEERETFHLKGRAKTTNDLWQRQAARRIMALIDNYRPASQAVMPCDGFSSPPTIR